MGNQKQKWTSEEEEALRAGVAKHGTGKWKNILTDPQFAPSLVNRSNIDLKDKWRNLSVSGSASGSREKVKFPKLQGLAIDPPSDSPIPSSDVLLLEYDCTTDPSKSSLDKKILPKYNEMIFEALSSTEDSNGLDVNAIHSFIEQRHEVPQSFRRLLTSKLRRLVLQGKLEKVENFYKIKDPSSETETPKEEEDIRPNNNYNDNDNNTVENSNDKQKTVQSYVSSPTAETVEDAAFCAAYRVAEAENKSYVAAEAFKEADRISKIAEEAEVMLELAAEIYEQCSRDGMVLLAV